jgi:uncharacterized protein YceH (UPF0502 family)
MPDLLGAAEIRVLGSLIEKEITTPDYYPLSLNALVNACNQRSSRDPMMQLDLIAVERALSSLQDRGMAAQVHDSRVPKFEHRIREVLDLRRPEIALLCLLTLRGPQTAGELRNRSERLYAFDDIATVQSTLDRLTRETESGRRILVAQLPRQPGEKESRYAHTLGSQAADTSAATSARKEPAPAAATSDAVARLEAQLADLRDSIEELRSRLEKLESQRIVE